MKTSELTGAALDWAVAKCEWLREEGDWRGAYRADYSTDWAQGGPIIEREISKGMQLGRKTTGALTFCFYAEYQGPMWEQLRKHYGPTPLIAAMRCYVSSKLGDEVEIPEELMA